MSSSPSPHPALPASVSAFLRQDAGAAQQAAAYLSPLVIAIAAALLLLNGLVSLWMSLGLHKKIAVSALRWAALPVSVCAPQQGRGHAASNMSSSCTIG